MSRLQNPKRCSKCGARGTVTDSRPLVSIGSQRRHHVCKCGHEWNTFETVLDPRRIKITINTPTRAVVTKPR
jgi:transcriptional regulator NrdR family protein